jgi:hypothetical protein
MIHLDLKPMERRDNVGDGVKHYPAWKELLR